MPDNVTVFKSTEHMCKCDECGRVFRGKKEGETTCSDCERLIRLGIIKREG